MKRFAAVLLATALTTSASAGDLPLYGGIGGTWDLGLSGFSTSVWGGGIIVYGPATWLMCGGVRGFIGIAGLRIGGEGEYCGDLQSYFKVEAAWGGITIGKEAPRGDRMLVGGRLGFGYGQLVERYDDYSTEYMYFRPAAYATIPLGPIAAEFSLYGMLPMPFNQQIGGRQVYGGWFPWGGVEVTLYLGSFKKAFPQRRPPPVPQPYPATTVAPPPPPPPSDGPLAIPGPKAPPPPQ